MGLKLLVTLAIASLARAQSLTDLISQTPDLSTLGSLVTQYPTLVSALSNATNVTVLAPTNAAFSSFLAQPGVNDSISADPGLVMAVLQYHVLQGTILSSAITEGPIFAKTLLTNSSYTNVTGGQVVEAERDDDTVIFTSGLLRESRVTTADVNFTGGIVHIIDSVLTVPVSPSDTVTAANLTALAGALTTVNLVATVDGLSDVTVFAPDNAAFATIQNLVANVSTEQLASVLTYHVVNGTVGYSTSLTNGANLATVQGGTVRITVEDDNDIFVNSAEVEVANVLLSNGVAHVIDNVLNPGNSTATPGANATEGSPAFSGASSGLGVPFTSGITATATATGAGASPTSDQTATTAGGPRQTAAVGAAALFGGAAFLANF